MIANFVALLRQNPELAVFLLSRSSGICLVTGRFQDCLVSTDTSAARLGPLEKLASVVSPFAHTFPVVRSYPLHPDREKVTLIPWKFKTGYVTLYSSLINYNPLLRGKPMGNLKASVSIVSELRAERTNLVTRLRVSNKTLPRQKSRT